MSGLFQTSNFSCAECIRNNRSFIAIRQMSLIIRHMKSSASEIGLEFTFDLTIVSYIVVIYKQDFILQQFRVIRDHLTRNA